jgi:drug/metabolite transporter (DMT)-like permease
VRPISLTGGPGLSDRAAGRHLDVTALLALGVLAALASAVLYSAGVTLQAIEARDAPCEESLKLSLLRWLVHRRRWLAGTSCVAGGWAMQATALMLAPITIVQPALAVSVVSLLFIAVRFFGESVRPRELLAALAIVIGVAGLVLVAPQQTEAHAKPLTLSVGMAVLGAIALAPYALRGHRRFGAFVVISAGLAYAWTGFSTKFLADSVSSGAWVVAALWLGATAVAGVVGLLSEMTALQSRSAIRVFPVVLVVQIVVAVLLAPLLAGESWSPDALVVAGLVASLVVVSAGTRALAGADAVGAVIGTDEAQRDSAAAADEVGERDQRGEGDSAHHQEDERQRDADGELGRQREDGGRGRDQAGRRDREPREAVAVLQHGEPR